MPANLPPETKKKWVEVTLTRNPEEKLRLMGEFLSMVPKHKGTEKMCRQVKRQMAQLRDEIEEKKKTSKRRGGFSYFIEKAGAAQIAIIGPTNAGRSSLLKAITNATVEVASWPFTTKLPTPGMLHYLDIQFQLVEAPAIVKGSSEGKFDGFQVLSLARNADGLIIMLDLTDDPVGNLNMIVDELENARILITDPEGSVEITRRGYGRDIQFIWDGDLVDCTSDDVVKLLGEYRIRSALVRIKGKVSLETVEDAIYGNAVYRPTMILANKVDLKNDREILECVWKSAQPIEVFAVSVENTKGLGEKLGKCLFEMLKIIRVYTKQPGKEAATEPIVARKGINVGDLAKSIHSDFYKNFKHAKIWGPSAKYEGERVGLDRCLDDGDVIQFHA